MALTQKEWAAQQKTMPSYAREGYNPQYDQIGYLSYLTQTAEDEARAKNIEQYEQLMEIAEKGITRYQPGGAFEKAGLAQIEAAKTTGVGAETQKLISSGLYGTEVGAGVERGWEADIGTRARLTLEDIMQQQLTGAERFKAGIVERPEYTYPDYGVLMQAVQASTATSSYTPSYGDYGTSTFAAPSTPFIGKPANVSPATSTYAKPTTTTAKPTITMGQGYGPAFQTQAEMARVAGGTAITPQDTTMPLTFAQWKGKNPSGTNSQYLSYYNKLKK